MWIPDIMATSDPIYLAIAKAIAADVEAGRLTPGDPLPTHRELAVELAVSIGTVTRGYIEAQRRGLIRGEIGRGTFVCSPGDVRTDFSRSGRMANGTIDLGFNYPVYSEDPDLGEALGRLAGQAGVSQLLRYVSPHDVPRYVQAGAEWLGRWGVEAPLERVVICGGAQHAIASILSAVSSPGDRLLADALTFPGVMTAAGLRPLRLEGVPMDGKGMRPAALSTIRRQRRVQLLYCLPTIQNPTGVILSEGRRREIVRVAREHDLLIIEDDVHRRLVPDAPPSLTELAPERTFFIATTSKAVAGGLRIAYVVAPPTLVERLKQAVWASISMVAPLMAELSTMWIEDGTADEVCARKCAEAAARQAIAREILGERAFEAHPHAYFIWLPLPEGRSSADVAMTLLQRGVAVSRADAFAIDPERAPEALRICLGAAEDRAQLRRGLNIIRDVLDSERVFRPALV